MFLFSFGKVQATENITYDAIIKRIDMQFQHDWELKYKVQFFSFHDITDHCTIKGTNSSYEVIVHW